MRMVSITEMRRSAKAVLDDIIRTKKPVAILQRSKPVAYIIDAESYVKLQSNNKEVNMVESRKKSLEKILQLKDRAKQNTGAQQEDSVQMIRDLREDVSRYE
ncbi:hypothetical protein N752_00100 [Desulforamulus aquiferis]|nr:type II toxin-antitoxin system Phd/YefM family antitoxin [Desulforamulus aquiferis]RYD07015.1 hypothetical protein N752_00100 [Desulforamulus aquiferis]